MRSDFSYEDSSQGAPTRPDRLVMREHEDTEGVLPQQVVRLLTMLLAISSAATLVLFGRNWLPGWVAVAGRVVGDELGEMLQQVRWPTGAMLAAEAAVFQVADGSMEPGPGGVHDHGGGAVDQLGDGDPVAHRWPGAPGRAHGPRAEVGSCRSARIGPGGAQQPHQHPDRVALLVGGGRQQAGKHLPGLGARPGAVATPALAAHDRGADGLLRAPVGGLDPRDGNKGEQRVALAAQVGKQPPVRRRPDPSGDALVDRPPELVGLGRDPGRVQLAGVALLAHRKRALQDPPDRMWGGGLAALGVVEQFAAAAQQVR